jgi:aspartyl protease family protein
MNRYILGLLILGAGLIVLLLSGGSGTAFGISTDDLGQLVYLGAIATVVGAGVLYRSNISATLRGIAAWLAIVLALVAGYQYRYELQDIASRVTAGLVPGSPLSVTDADGRVSVMMDKQPNGHFEVLGSVQGAPIEFLVDTGATSTVLTSRDAEAAGFDLGSLAFNIPVSTANGIAQAAKVRASEITVGKIVRRNQTIMVAQDGSLGQSLLGMSFITTLSGFDMRGDRLILRD